MREEFVVMTRGKWHEKDQVTKSYSIQWKAEQMAQKLFTECLLDRVAVVRGTPYNNKLEIVYLQERVCKHRCVQGWFTFNGVCAVFRCVACNEIIRKGKELEQVREVKDGDEQISEEEVEALSTLC